VFAAFILLVLLIAAAPLTLFSDGTLVQGLVVLVTALSLGVVAVEIRPAEAAHLTRLIRPALILLLVPVLWMLVQLLPMPFGSLSHPIWASAAEALNSPLTGHISIDLGATLIGLFKYLATAGILMIATAVTIDRVRAELTLYWLTAATAVAAVGLIANGLSGFAAPDARTGLQGASALGIAISAAATIRSIERYETRRSNAEMSLATFGRSLAAGLLALAVCALAIIFAAPAQVTFAAGCGFGAVVLVVIIRRFGLGLFAAGALVAVAIIVAIEIASSGLRPGGENPTLRFAAAAAPSAMSTAERMMTDNAVGTGVGTFKALLPIYRDIDDAPAATAPTTAAQIAIEMGRPAPWIVVLMMLAATGIFLRGALRRGRDSFYAAGAAGCAVTLTAEAFTDASLLGTAVVILAASVLGLGLAQSESRTAQ